MQFYQKNITYKGISDKGLTLQLIDSEDGKWTIWKKDAKDKEKDSDAFLGLKGYSMGDTFGISYSEKENSFIGKEGNPITYTQRTIYSIMPQIDESATRTPQPQDKPSQVANIAPQRESSDDFGRRLAVHGMINGLLANPNWTLEAVQANISKVVALEDAINKELSKPKGWDNLGNKLKESVAPDIQERADEMESETVDTSDIPF